MRKFVLGIILIFGIVGVGYAASFSRVSLDNFDKLHSDSGVFSGVLPGFYVGVGAGYGGMRTAKYSKNYSANIIRIIGGFPHSEKRFGFAARAYGGYLWAIPQVQHFWLGPELGYNYYSKNKYIMNSVSGTHNWQYRGYNIDLLGVAKYNFYNFARSGFSILVKAGPAYVCQKLDKRAVNTATGVVYTAHVSVDKLRMECAAGVGYDINQNVDVNLVVSRVFGAITQVNSLTHNHDLTKAAPIDTILFSVAYHFGDFNKWF